MLIFEFFPAFVALVSVVAGVWLFMLNLEAEREAEQAQPADVPLTTPPERNGANKAAAIGFIAVVLSGPAAFAQGTVPAIARAADLSGSLEAAARLAGPAVVEIFTTSYRAGDGLEPNRAELVTTERASGSGVVVDANGYIVTNAHVVNGAHRVRVEIPRPTDGRSILGARSRALTGEIVGMDRETDLAVIKVEASGLPTLRFADSDDLRAGQLVMAFGSPLGLNNSVSLGIVSAVARQLEPESPMVYVQTDASINHGSSGGPLVDLHGRIVGINTLLVSRAGGDDGLGFAAPSNIVRTVYEQIRANGRVRRGDIGIRAQTVTPALARGLNLPRDYGVVIADVTPNSTAARSGLRPGDLVLALDGKPMENGRQLHVGLYRRFVGDVVSFEILRDVERMTLPVTMLERRDPFSNLPTPADPRANLVPRLGILGLTLDSRVAAMLPALRVSSGVVVVSTMDGAIDSRDGGLDDGDVVFAVNRTAVGDLGELRTAVAGLSSGDPVVLQLERQGALMYLTFTIE